MKCGLYRVTLFLHLPLHPLHPPPPLDHGDRQLVDGLARKPHDPNCGVCGAGRRKGGPTDVPPCGRGGMELGLKLQCWTVPILQWSAAALWAEDKGRERVKAGKKQDNIGKYRHWWTIIMAVWPAKICQMLLSLKESPRLMTLMCTLW